MYPETIINTYNSKKKFNPFFDNNHIPKPMLLTKILKLIDLNPDNFKDWGCKSNCVKSPCYFKYNDPVTIHVCCKLYT